MAEVQNLTIEEFAERARVPVETVRHWMKTGKAPRWIKPGRSRLFPLAEVERWEQEMIDNGGKPKRRSAA